MKKSLIVFLFVQCALPHLIFGQFYIPQTVQTQFVQTSVGDIDGTDLKMPPRLLCTFFYFNNLNFNTMKYSDCNALQDAEEIVFVKSENITGTPESWSKHYIGYVKGHEVYYGQHIQSFNIHMTLIYRNSKYSVLMESAGFDKNTGATSASVANMYYNP